MSENGLLGQIAGALAEALASLGSITADPSIAAAMFARLGYDVTIDDDAMVSLGGLFPSGEDMDILRAVAADVRDGDGIELESIVGVMEVAARVVDSLSGLAPGASAIANLPPPLNDASTWTAQGLGGAIADDLLWAWLTTRLPFLSAALQVLGVVEEWVDPVSGATRVHVNWPQLSALVNDPRSALDAAYGWSGEFVYGKALVAVISAGQLMGLEADFGDVTQAEYDVHFAPTPVPPSIQAAHLFFFKGFVPGTEAYGEVGLSLTPIPESPGLDVSGLSLANRSSVAAGVDVSLGGDWRLEFAAGADASSAYYIEWWPGARPGIHGAAPTFDVELALVGEPAAPWRIGAQDGPRLELGGVRLSAEMVGTAADPEFVLGLETLGDGLVLFVPVGSGDSFIKEVVPQAIEAGIELDVEWSSKKGVTFGGGTSFRLVIPLNKDIGPLHLQYVEVELQPGTRTALIFGVAAGVTIGPVDIVINGVGLQVELDVTDGPDATFGPFDVGLAFKPPHGIGVAIDIEDVIRGGGYLELNPDRGEYAGVFDVDVLGLGVTAIGLLTTPLPGQEDGWSLFFSISARFPVPIQIGFGLTLNALGALFGLHRRMDTEAVAAGISDGSIDAILFPADPVANAPAIIESLRTSFPPAQGQYVFGAMLELGWLSDSIITAQLGVLVQLPDPLQIVLVGQIESMLPLPDNALIELHADFIGVIDLTAGTLAIDAGIRDSRIVQFTLSGEMAVRASFLDSPSILVSAGGFHPAFKAPPGTPDLDRMAVALSVPAILDVRLEAYIAITSNTVQFGSRISIWGKAASLEAEGYAAFDTLITLSPFGFLTTLSFGVAVRKGSLDLISATLVLEASGPKPWFFQGTATVTILGLDTDFHIEETIGQAASIAAPPRVHVAEAVRDDLNQLGNWSVVGSSDAGGVVLSPPVEGEPVLDPGGLVQVTQRTAPMEIELEHLGETSITGPRTVHLAEARMGSTVVATSTVEDWFASGQFWELGRSEKLGAPSFEQHPAGYLLAGAAGTKFGVGRAATLDHDTALWEDDSLELSLDKPPTGILDRDVIIRGTSVAIQSQSTAIPKSQFQLRDRSFVAASTTSGRVLSRSPGTFVSARQLVDPQEAQTVVPREEVSV